MNNTKTIENSSTIQIVMAKYIKSGKEVVKYDTSTGKCWVEVHVGDLVKTKKEFTIIPQ